MPHPTQTAEGEEQVWDPAYRDSMSTVMFGVGAVLVVLTFLASTVFGEDLIPSRTLAL